MIFTATEIFFILFIHWIADFIFQDEKWALGKSKNNYDLTMHVLTYSSIWFGCTLGWWVLNSFIIEAKVNTALLFFAPITFVCHWITDYLTSRIVSKKFANKQFGSAIPNLGAFTVIGFDQLLHYLQLFLTYDFLKNLNLEEVIRNFPELMPLW